MTVAISKIVLFLGFLLLPQLIVSGALTTTVLPPLNSTSSSQVSRIKATVAIESTTSVRPYTADTSTPIDTATPSSQAVDISNVTISHSSTISRNGTPHSSSTYPNSGPGTNTPHPTNSIHNTLRYSSTAPPISNPIRYLNSSVHDSTRPSNSPVIIDTGGSGNIPDVLAPVATVGGVMLLALVIFVVTAALMIVYKGHKRKQRNSRNITEADDDLISNPCYIKSTEEPQSSGATELAERYVPLSLERDITYDYARFAGREYGQEGKRSGPHIDEDNLYDYIRRLSELQGAPMGLKRVVSTLSVKEVVQPEAIYECIRKISEQYGMDCGSLESEEDIYEYIRRFSELQSARTVSDQRQQSVGTSVPSVSAENEYVNTKGAEQTGESLYPNSKVASSLCTTEEEKQEADESAVGSESLVNKEPSYLNVVCGHKQEDTPEHHSPPAESQGAATTYYVNASALHRGPDDDNTIINPAHEVDRGADAYVNVAALRQGPDDDVHHCSPANEVDSGADTYVNVAALRQGPDDDVHHCSPANEVDSGADTYVNVAALRQGPDDDVHHCSPANVIGGGNGPDDSNERQEQNVISAVQDIQKQHSEIKTDTDQYQSSEEN